MTNAQSQKGFTLIEGVLVVGILGIIGFTGYRIWQAQTEIDNTSQAAKQALNQPATQTAPAITNSADLDKAAKSLDQTDLNTDASALDKDLNF